MRHVIWTNEAQAALAQIRRYIAADNPEAAQNLADRIVAVADGLAEFPYKGWPAGPGVRRISAVYPYILKYRIRGDRIYVLRVYHGARNIRSPRSIYATEQSLPAL
jgi:plasmid stabilization system protein ParE